MKALVKKESKPGIWLEEVPFPPLKENEVLIKTRKNSICGTDLHIYKWDAWAQKTVPVPLIIGHEFVGEIAEVGNGVKGLKIGQRVGGEGHLTCGLCSACKKGKKHLCMNTLGLGYHTSGTFAEYFTLPAENVFVFPETIPDDLAAIFDPLGNAVHTALSFDLVGEDVLITGAGPIGLMAAAVAKKAGARHIVITDLNPFRLELAKKMGATRIVDVSKESLIEVKKELGMEEGFTVGLEMSGAPAGLKAILETTQSGANIGLLGLLPPGTIIDWDLVIFKLLKIKGIWGREIFDTWFKMTHLLESGLDISPVITHVFPLEEYEKGFQAMLSGNCGKVILNW